MQVLAQTTTDNHAKAIVRSFYALIYVYSEGTTGAVATDRLPVEQRTIHEHD